MAKIEQRLESHSVFPQQSVFEIEKVNQWGNIQEVSLCFVMLSLKSIVEITRRPQGLHLQMSDNRTGHRFPGVARFIQSS